MFLCATRLVAATYSFPRVRGDVPEFLGEFISGGAFSPRARGCSGRGQGYSLGV